MAFEEYVAAVDRVTVALAKEEERLKFLDKFYQKRNVQIEENSKGLLKVATTLERVDSSGRKIIQTFKDGALVLTQVQKSAEHAATSIDRAFKVQNAQTLSQELTKQEQGALKNAGAFDNYTSSLIRNKDGTTDVIVKTKQLTKEGQEITSTFKNGNLASQEITKAYADQKAQLDALVKSQQRQQRIERNRKSIAFRSELTGREDVSLALKQDPASTLAQLNSIDKAFQRARISTDAWRKAFNAGLNKELRTFRGEAGQAYIEGRRFAESLDAVSKRAKDAKNGTDQLTLSWKSFERLILARVVTQVFHNFVLQITESVRESAELLKNLGEVQTIAGPLDKTAAGFERLADASFRFSSHYGFGIQDSIEAFYDNLSNQVADSASELEFFNTQAAKLAKATKSTLEQSSNTISAILNAYNLGYGESARIAAQLFVTVDEGRLRLEEIANTFGRIAVPAAQLGVQLEEINSALSTLTISGIPATEGMTLLRNVMFKLQRPTEAMKDLFKQWGVNSGDAAVSTYGFSEILRKLNIEAAKGSEEFGKLFGRIRAFRGGLGLTGTALADYEDNLVKLGDAQDAFDEAYARVFENKGDIAKRELNKVKNAITQDFAIPIVKLFADVSKEINVLDDIIKFLAEFAILGGVLGTIVAVGKTIGPLLLTPAGAAVGVVAGLTAGMLYLATTTDRAYLAISEKINTQEMERLEKVIAKINKQYDILLDLQTRTGQRELRNLATLQQFYNQRVKQLETIIDFDETRKDREIEILETIFDGNEAQRVLVKLYKDYEQISNKFNVSVKLGNEELEKRQEIVKENIDALKEELKASDEYSKTLLKKAEEDRFNRALRSLTPQEQIQAQFNRADQFFRQGIQLFKAGDEETARSIFKEAYDLLSAAESDAFSSGLLGTFERHTLFFENAFNRFVAANQVLEQQYTQDKNSTLREQENIEARINFILEDRKNLLESLKATREFDKGQAERIKSIFENENLTIAERLRLIDNTVSRTSKFENINKRLYEIQLKQLEVTEAQIAKEKELEGIRALNASKRQTATERENAISNLRTGVLPTQEVSIPFFAEFGTRVDQNFLNQIKILTDRYVNLNEQSVELYRVIEDQTSTPIQIANALERLRNLYNTALKISELKGRDNFIIKYEKALAAIDTYFAAQEKIATETQVQNEQSIEASNVAIENYRKFNTVITTANQNIQLLTNSVAAFNRAIERRRNIPIERFASGGPVGTDTIPAWLSPGEYVVNAAATRRNYALLTSINSGTRPQYYSQGGVVTNTFHNTFQSTTSPNIRVNARRSAAEIRRQIGLGQTTLKPKSRMPF